MLFFLFFFFIIYLFFFFFFFNDTATTEIYTLSLHDALPIWPRRRRGGRLLGSQIGDRVAARQRAGLVTRPQVGEELSLLLRAQLGVEQLLEGRRVRVRRAPQELVERRRLPAPQPPLLDRRLELDLRAREPGVVRELEHVALADPPRERPRVAHVDPEEAALGLREREAVDRLEHRQPPAVSQHAEELR